MVLNEQDVEKIEAALGTGAIVSSALLILEVTRCFVRLGREGRVSPMQYQQLWDRFRLDCEEMTFKELDEQMCLDPAFPKVAIPKAADLAHLKTALWFHAIHSDLYFLTCDLHQRAAAEELGLRVIQI